MKKPLLLLAPAALLFLASCSSEPSDWRPEQKVSLDVVPPGTRVSERFDKDGDASGDASLEAPRDPKHDPIGQPASKVLQGNLTRRAAPTAGAVMSADTKPENAKKSVNSGTSSQTESNEKHGE
ncbi:hypothetical protein [Hymenobacter sp. BT559]|jgi:hypothetical protein|uniref:hypothetical protein n=1 Tax=Hymenobacter sp. BT559 TaxID=2795729 RepID=UPI0018EABFB6|nr:hypothetical protein [Hymenobacter sp. BT559]MBJ6143262.1 hypothetical protein [Hymenobacter sp. BT559]